MMDMKSYMRFHLAPLSLTWSDLESPAPPVGSSVCVCVLCGCAASYPGGHLGVAQPGLVTRHPSLQ